MSLKQPVRYPVKYYSHLDVGAPQLASVDGNIKTIIKACLITGIGAKAGAGWTSLFEDDYRIVLRRPLGTGNPPDIKIENGVIGGAASHRIVSQDNPTGLNDANELASVNLIARTKNYGTEWHLIASDFGFILCYQMAENVDGIDGYNSLIYVGSIKKIKSANPEKFVTSTSSLVKRDGTTGNWLGTLLSKASTNYFKDMRTNINYSELNFLELNLSEMYYSDYLAQSIMLGNDDVLPFLAPVAKNTSDKATKVIDAGNRPMLRYAEAHHTPPNPKPIYIPLDYWEL